VTIGEAWAAGLRRVRLPIWTPLAYIRLNGNELGMFSHCDLFDRHGRWAVATYRQTGEEVTSCYIWDDTHDDYEAYTGELDPMDTEERAT